MLHEPFPFTIGSLEIQVQLKKVITCGPFSGNVAVADSSGNDSSLLSAFRSMFLV